MNDNRVRIGEIWLHAPGGHATSIAVDRTADGTVEIHIDRMFHIHRTSEGDALIRLPHGVAKQLSDFLAEATEGDA